MKKEGEDNKENIRLITTDDGSHSLYVPSLNETYHSFHGAVQESRHVFIKMGLEQAVAQNSPRPIKIFEVGLGTGLNALLVAEFSHQHNISVSFTSIEAFPVEYQLAKSLNYPQFLQSSDAAQWFETIHLSAWDATIQVHPLLTFTKIASKLEEYKLASASYDVIFFDAFAPNKQAELWNLEILGKIANSMAPNGIFVTYCAKGQLKRDLASLGLKVETLAGPPGKKEMVRAIKIQ